MSIWWSLHLRRDAASVPLARRSPARHHGDRGGRPGRLLRPLRRAQRGLRQRRRARGRTAHGGSSEAYRVTAYLDGEKCRIEVADSGPGFPPARGRPPIRPARTDAEGGRGLCLIQELADHVRIGNKPGRDGAVVSFYKILKWREDAPLMAV